MDLQRPRAAPPNDQAQAALVAAFDGHDAGAVRAALDAGADACLPFEGKAPLGWLLEAYTRSDRFQPCLRLLLERGASLGDPGLEAVLLNDADAVRAAAQADPALASRRVTLTSAFAPLVGATLLHVAAEYGNAAAAEALVASGADVNAAAALDPHGLNGHTPLFHVVNSNRNRSAPILKLLLGAGARADLRLAGLTWGQGFDWETTFFDVTPISFAQMGLTPQMHRDERDIYANVTLLLRACGRPVPPLTNVPNRYLR